MSFTKLAISYLFSYHENIFNNKIDKLNKRKFGSSISPVSELEQRTAIALINTNPVFDFPISLPENVIPVGGLQIRETKPLPKV